MGLTVEQLIGKLEQYAPDKKVYFDGCGCQVPVIAVDTREWDTDVVLIEG